MQGIKHLKWLAAGVIIGFLVPFVFGDRLTLPLDLYYLIYFAAVGTFFAVYIKKTGLNVREWLSRRLAWGLALGVVFGLVMVKFVLTNPATEGLSGSGLAWAVLWKGLFYGVVDGLFLSVFPWVVTWRAFGVADKPLGRKIGFGVLAWAFITVMTAAYHAGYADYRSPKLAKTFVGNTIISIPTLVAANPVGSPITHAMMHVAVVLHCPKTDLFLPPHRD